jgi:hypothetical protein
MRYFVKLRNEIEKQASDNQLSAKTHIQSFSTSDIARFGPAPPNATSLFIGDSVGGSGWEVKLAKGASLKSTEQPIDTTSAAGKAFLDMLGVFAEFETNLRKERQAEGIAKAKAAGVYKGRPPSIDIGKVQALKQKGLGASQIAKALKIGRASVYRALDAR